MNIHDGFPATVTPDDALIGPNPRDVVIQEIVKAKEKQVSIDIRKRREREQNLFSWATQNLAYKYFGLTSLECFDPKKLGSLQDLIYEKAKRDNIRHKVIMALIPIVGWMAFASLNDDMRSWPTHKFVKFYKKFRENAEAKK